MCLNKRETGGVKGEVKGKQDKMSACKNNFNLKSWESQG